MIAAFALVAILALLVIFQIALAAGAPWGQLAWGGQHRVLPDRLRRASAFSIVIYAGIALFEFDRVGVIQLLPEPLSIVVAWVVFAYFCIGIVLNAISRSRAERFVMTPVVLVLAVLSLLVALS